MNPNKIKLKRLKAFDIKETDSIEKIEEIQKQLKEYIIKLKNLYDAIEEFKQDNEKYRPDKKSRVRIRV